MQQNNLITVWDQLCQQCNRLIRVKRWMLTHFSDTSGNLIVNSDSYHAEIIGDAILFGQYSIISNYSVSWN